MSNNLEHQKSKDVQPIKDGNQAEQMMGLEEAFALLKRVDVDIFSLVGRFDPRFQDKKLPSLDALKTKIKDTKLAASLGGYVEELMHLMNQPDEGVYKQLDQRKKKLQELRRRNLQTAVDSIQPIKKTIHQIALAYKNGGTQLPKPIFVMVDEDQLESQDLLQIVEATVKEAQWELAKEKWISFISLPDFPKEVIGEFASLGERYKVMVLADYRDVENTAELLKNVAEKGDDEGLIKNDKKYAHLAFYTNWLKVGTLDPSKEKKQAAKEGDLWISGVAEPDLYVGPATAVTGAYIAMGDISQGVAGFGDGSIEGIDGIRFNALEDDLGDANAAYFNLMAKASKGTKIVWGIKTAIALQPEGKENTALTQIPVMRVFNYLDGYMRAWFNSNMFKKLNGKDVNRLSMNFLGFMRKIKGEGIIDSFKMNKFYRDPRRPSSLLVDVEIEPNWTIEEAKVKLKISQDPKDEKSVQIEENTIKN